MHVTTARVTIDRGSGSYALAQPLGKDGNFHWSQYGQDKYVDEYLGGMTRGFFVEIGGFDGETHSNTLFFEHERKWDGLPVEANPYTYNQMRDRDRRCNMANACISTEFNQMTFEVAGGITSAVSLMSKDHKQRIKHDSKVYGKQKNWTGTGSHVNVTCHSLNEYLDRLDTTSIDYFSLDVEGAELHILKSIDWKKADINLFTIETQERRGEIHAFMVKQGYSRITRLGQDDVFVLRSMLSS